MSGLDHYFLSERPIIILTFTAGAMQYVPVRFRDGVWATLEQETAAVTEPETGEGDVEWPRP